MMLHCVARNSLILAACALASFVGTARAQQEKAATNSALGQLDFAHEIVPILQKRCAKCHSGTQKKGGFSINTRQSFLAGGDSGPAVVLRKSAESSLIERVTSEDPDLRMPPEGERLTRAQLDLLRRWIDLDLSWEDGFAFGKLSRQAPLPPRRPTIPEVPAGSALTNPIDRFLSPYFAKHHFDARPNVPDAVFARRAALDLVGLAPTPAELAAFEADSVPEKRDRFVERMLADRPAFAAHWLTFWNDLLRNAYHGTGFIDGGRKQITGWLYAALDSNLPYDRFVHELVSPDPQSGSEGFTYGIKWRGTVNESQRREIQAAQSIGQVFLGTNLKCASCHDSFVNHWKLTDAYALASVFADAPLELHRCDQPTGIASTVGFLYPDVGTIDPRASRPERMKQLADLLVSPQNGRLARTIVNRLWAKLFGRGLVEQLDNMDAEPWNQDLLDFLAADLADHGYDLKHTLRLMATSRAYQLPGVASEGAGTGEPFVFRGPLVKRLSAEQFVDAVFGLTSTWPAADPAWMKPDGRAQGGQLGAVALSLENALGAKPVGNRRQLGEAKWIWSRESAREAAPPQTIYLRRVWPLDERPLSAIATFSADNSFELFVNGKSVMKSDNWGAPAQADVAEFLKSGGNVIALKAANGGSSPNPAGTIGEIAALNAQGKLVALLSTDATWRVSETEAAGWLKSEFDGSSWRGASVLGDASVGPWNIAEIIARGAVVPQAVARLPAGFKIRAALLPLDSLQAALGRPNREQVVSQRDAAPTMLQSLELTNGSALGQLVQRGAAHWHKQGLEPKQLVDQLYRTALMRPPSDAETQVALAVLGDPASAEGLEDLLWLLCMLPEFQLVP